MEDAQPIQDSSSQEVFVFKKPLVDTEEYLKSTTSLKEEQPIVPSQPPEQGVPPNKLTEFLTSFQCKSPMFPNDFGTVVRISSNETIRDAFKKMLSYQIMAIPVVNSENGKPVYILSMMNIIEFLMKHYSLGDFKANLLNSIKNMFASNKTETFLNTKLSEIEANGNFVIDPVYTVTEDAFLLEAVDLMLKYSAHRVVVLNQHDDLINVITQSRLIQFISNFVDSIPTCKKSLFELKLHNRPLICVLENQTAYEAFKIMQERQLTGIAVINSSGTLLGNISISDLKLIGYQSTYWNLLSKTVTEYLQAIRENPDSRIRSHAFAMLEDSSSKYPLVLKCRPHHTLGFVIRMLVYYKVHRIYVVDDYGVPTGIITLTDVLRELVK